jgi:mannose-6-phosphate isomerase-like protein (cupin superfamily)
MKILIQNNFIRIGILFCLILGQSAIAQDKTYNIEDCVNIFSEDKTIPTKVGYQYWFADKDFLDGRTIKMSVVAPGKSTHEPHQHPEDEFFFVLEGTAQFHLDGKEVVVEAHTSLYCPSNSVYGIKNVGETELKYLVIKTYKE